MAQFAHDSYILPASYDSVPTAWKSNSSAKPLPSSIQCVNVPALTANASASGTSIIQLPCGSSAGIMMNPYIRLDMKLDAADATTTFMFKGTSKCATSLLNRVSTYINSVQIDNIQNADAVYDTIFSHATSYDWLTHDAQVLMGAPVRSDAGVASADAAGAASIAAVKTTYILPLIGALGTQQGVPLFALNGTLQLQLDYNSLTRAVYSAVGTAPTGFVISNVQLVYDRVSVEQAFVDKVRSDMAAGAKYVLAYSNFQSTAQASAVSGFLNYGLNVSSLKAVVAQQMLTADLGTIANLGSSVVNGLSQFQVSLDGRLLNSNTLDATNSPALVFAELNKCFSRLFDASITDVSTRANYPTTSFAVGVSAQRCGEALAFSGSPVSILGINFITSNTTHTLFITFISDYQLLIDSSGSVEIVR
jgi:hypothetical protein